MASLNKVMIIGNLGRDPETRYMPSGDAMTTIAVATTETWKDKQTGEKKDATEWHRIVFFGKLAEIAQQYLKKGTQVYVEGSLRTNRYTDKDGIEKYSTEIRADEMKMLGNRPGSNGSPSEYTEQNTSEPRNQAPASRPATPQPRPTPPVNQNNLSNSLDDDIPF